MTLFNEIISQKYASNQYWMGGFQNYNLYFHFYPK